jgi:hypothetical protein
MLAKDLIDMLSKEDPNTVVMVESENFVWIAHELKSVRIDKKENCPTYAILQYEA